MDLKSVRYADKRDAFDGVRPPKAGVPNTGDPETAVTKTKIRPRTKRCS